MSGGEHDHKGLSAEGVCTTGLTAIIIGVVFSNRHRLIPEDGRHYIKTYFAMVLLQLIFY